MRVLIADDEAPARQRLAEMERALGGTGRVPVTGRSRVTWREGGLGRIGRAMSWECECSREAPAALPWFLNTMTY